MGDFDRNLPKIDGPKEEKLPYTYPNNKVKVKPSVRGMVYGWVCPICLTVYGPAIKTCLSCTSNKDNIDHG